MIKKIIISIIFVTNIFAAVITGNQSKVSITGGSMDVSAQGVTQTVNSGQMTTIGEGKAPTKARGIYPGDFNDVYSELSAEKEKRNINIRFVPVNFILAKKIKSELIKKKLIRSKFKFKRSPKGTELTINNTSLKSIRDIYPNYYKILSKFFDKPKNKGTVPTITIQVRTIKKYHFELYKKYY
ncbi:MAG TPA: hypothetical protein EYG97_00675 [Arcobacter sp.]|nr:hypothetical protein [Arcobacter sp.]